MVTSRKRRKKRAESVGHVGLRLFSVCTWPVILCMVGLVLPRVIGEDVPGAVTTTSYTSGVVCGDPPRICLPQTTCYRQGSCLCPTGTYGDGSFQCHPANTVRTEITGSQPTLRTLPDTRAGFYWPCRFRYLEFTTVRNGHEQQQCHFQIFGISQILGGRVVVTGMEVNLQLKQGDTVIKGIGIRKEGRVKNKVFTYIERGRSEFIYESPITDTVTNSSQSMDDGSGSGDDSIIDEEENDAFDWGPPEELDLGDGERVACDVDENNFATINIPSCNAEFRLRAPNVDLSMQDQTPGISVTINDDNGPVEFQSPLTYLAETIGDDLLKQRARQKMIRLEHEILHQVMQNAARQYSTPEGRECEDTARIYRSYCSSNALQEAAFNSCSFFLTNPDLVSCMDPPGESSSSKSLNAFKLCLWHSCNPRPSACSLLKYNVQQNGCMSLTPSEFAQINCEA